MSAHRDSREGGRERGKTRESSLVWVDILEMIGVHLAILMLSVERHAVRGGSGGGVVAKGRRGKLSFVGEEGVGP